MGQSGSVLHPDLARAERDVAMARVEAKAEREWPGWRLAALRYVKLYCLEHAEDFIAEQLVAAAKEYGLQQPDNPKAWGPVIHAAKNAGYIEFRGWENSPNRHLSPTRLWRSLIVLKKR